VHTRIANFADDINLVAPVRQKRKYKKLKIKLTKDDDQLELE